MDNLIYLKNYIKKAEINAAAIIRDLNEPDKVFIEASETVEMIKGVKRELIKLGFKIE